MNLLPTPPSVQASARAALLAGLALLLAALTLAVYWPVARCEFINFDDPDYFAANPHVLGGLTGANLRWAFTTFQTANWHPLTWVSLMLDASLFGPGPAGPHLTNLLFHCANALLLFFWLRQLTGATWRSLLVAALFALHPLRVESVAWVAERKDVLSTCFALLTLLAYSRYAASPRSRDAHPKALIPTLDAPRSTLHAPPRPSQNSKLGNRPFWYLSALALFALGLLCKPMLVTLPFVFLLLDYWPLGRFSNKSQKTTLKPLLLEKLPFCFLSLASCLITFIAQKKGGAVIALVKISLAQRLENTFVAYARYLGKTLWPIPLATPYPYPHHWDPWLVAYAVALVLGLYALAWLCVRRFPIVWVGWSWFIGTLIPVIGLVQVGNQSLADRYTYLPGIGLFLLAVWGLHALWTARRWPASLAGLLAVALLSAGALRTRYQIGFWQNTGSLFQHALDVDQNNFTAWNNLGTWLSKNGLLDDAIGCFRQSLQIEPDNTDALYNLGNAFARQTNWNQAIRFYRRALEKNPAQLELLNNLGFALTANNQLTNAVDCFQAALKLDPSSASTHNNLAAVLCRQHRWEEAVQHYRNALRLVPDDPRICVNLGDALVQQGQAAQAAAAFQAALRLRPNDPQITARLRALGAALN